MYNNKDLLGEYLGIEKVEAIEEYSRDIADNCYELEIYQLSEGTFNSFIIDSKKKLPPCRIAKHLTGIYNWTDGPADSAYKEAIKVGLYMDTDDSTTNKHIKTMQQIFEHGKRYFAFYYKPGDYRGETIVFFLLDIQRRKLYIRL